MADAVSTGQARNVVMLATLAYATRKTAPADWLPLLPHVVTCLDVPTAPPPYMSLLDYLDGWDAGDLQRVPLTTALEAASTVLYKLDEPALALELADR